MVETNLATVEDVEKRLDEELDADARNRAEALLEEASALVEGYLGRSFDEVPSPVTVVVSRMVARVLQAPEPSFAVETLTQSAGAFSQSQKFTTGASGGSPWLTAVDKTVLSRFRKRRGLYSVSMT